MLEQFSQTTLSKVTPEKINRIALLSMISVVAAAALSCFGTIISLLRYYSLSKDFFLQFSYTLAGNIEWLLCGLLLPVSLFLLIESPQRAKLAKIFVIVSFVFFGLQLFSAIVGFISYLASFRSSGFLALMNSIAGNSLLDIFAYFLRALFSGYPINFLGMLQNAISSISSILYIAPNALCLFGLLKLSSMK